MELKKIFNLSVDLKYKNASIDIPEVRQNDSNRFVIKILDAGKVLTAEQLAQIETASLVNVYHKQEAIVTKGTLIGSSIAFDLGSGVTAETGRVQAVVQLYSATGRVSTITFNYIVVIDPTGKEYVPSEDERTLIEILIGDGPLVIQQAKDALDNAKQAAAIADNERRMTVAVREATEHTKEDTEAVREATEQERLAIRQQQILYEESVDGKVSIIEQTAEAAKGATAEALSAAEIARKAQGPQGERGPVAIDQNTVSGVGEINIWTGTVAEYDALPVKSPQIIYHARGV